MGINFGAALGAAAQSGANMYLKLGEEQRQEEELAMRRREADWQEEQRQQERKLNEITSQTLGMGDTRVTGQDYTGVTGGIDTAEPALRTEAYTPQQKMADFKQRALGAGIPIQKVTAISGAHRAEKYAEREEMALEFDNQIRADIKANQGNLEPVVKKYFQTPYNEGKVPELADGKTMDIVPTDAGGKAMVFKDSKGNTLRSVPLTIENVEKMTHGWREKMMASSSPANFWKSREEDLKSREVGVKEALVPSEIAKNKALANQANAHAGVFSNMLQASKDNKAAGEAMKPFIEKFSALTPEQQAGPEGQAILMQGATAGAKVSKDLTSLVTMLRKPDRAAVSAEQEKAAYADLQGATTPEQIRAVKAKWPDVFGPSALDKAIAERAKAAAKTPPATPAVEKPAAALPIKTPDFKVSGGRGHYTVGGLPTSFTTRADAEAAARKAQLGSREAEVAATLERDQ